jgi:hypothetical protein
VSLGFAGSRVNDFCQSVGLTPAVRAWLRDNPGDDLREQIVAALMEALDADCAPSHRSQLATLIARLTYIRGRR